MILAQLSTDPVPGTVEAWLKCLFWLCAGVLTIVWTVRLFKKPAPVAATISDQPLQVKGAVEFTPLEQHRELKERVDAISDDIKDGFRRIDERRSLSIGNLHETLRNDVTALRKEMKEDNQGVQNRISEVLGEVRELKGRIEERA